MEAERFLIGEYLVKKGLLTEEQLHDALRESQKTNRKIGIVLSQRGIVSEEDIAHALSAQLGFPFVDLDDYSIEEAAVRLITPDFAGKHQVLPIKRKKDSLEAVITNPLDVTVVDELSGSTGGLRVSPVIATSSQTRNYIRKYYGVHISDDQTDGASSDEGNHENIHSSETKSRETGKGSKDTKASKMVEEATRAPVIKLVNEIIENAVKAGASDIHLEPQAESLNCRYRIDGILHEIEKHSKKMQNAIISRIKIMGEMDIAQNRLPQDGRVQLTINKNEIDLRVASFPTIYGEHLALRILDRTLGVLKLEDLGFSKTERKRFKEIIHKPYGIILVTGPTGSGKTTTLYAALNKVKSLEKNIVTLEDPVEYTIPGTHQTRVNVKAGLTFATGLRSMLRLDPDIIMIGEIRDKETADIAIHASLTGHLVFSTLHTNDAASAVTRLVDIGVEPFLVSSSVIGIVAQRLIRQLCPECKKRKSITENEKKLLSKYLDETENELLSLSCEIYEPIGCKACSKTVYKGRVGLFELLVMDPKIRELVIKTASASQIKQMAVTQGMKLLRQDGMTKVLRGITSLSEVLSITEED